MGGWLSCALGLVLLVGCARFEPKPEFPAPDSTALARALSGELLLGAPVSPEQLPQADLFTLTPAMRIFAEESTQNRGSQYRRAEALHRALLNPGGLGILYYPYHTFTPRETFSARRANCISFTLLYVNMARHLGLNASFNEVDVPETWDIQGQDAFVLLRHVNTVVRMPDRSWVVIDLEMERYSPVYPQRAISEDLMAALYYNNRGMEWLSVGDVRQAFLYVRRALESSEERAYPWSNMAVIYRREGFYAEAEALYLQALTIVPDDLTAMSNLAALYQMIGRESDAQVLIQHAENYRNRNPYYIHRVAEKTLEEGEPEQALTLVLRAISLQEGEPRFYQLAADLYQQLGDERRAASMRQRAERAQPDQF